MKRTALLDSESKQIPQFIRNIQKYSDTYLDERRAQNLVMTIHLDEPAAKSDAVSQKESTSSETLH